MLEAKRHFFLGQTNGLISVLGAGRGDLLLVDIFRLLTRNVK
jgi:hypothetical protein